MKRNNTAVLGTFQGECADANITNLNGLDITREVWETVFSSDEYANGIENRWYIGYLGHPEDPGCQDFEHACIVMTEGHIDDNGKVYGSFDLIDTPVGRIVKSFIDAGVTFGISVRGAGDIVDNSVDPDTFVFRGFDIVTFPAYPEAIPEFRPVAASSDVEQQKKYKKVCAAVHANIGAIDSVETLDMLQSCVASQSIPYKEIESRKSALQSVTATVESRKLDAMTQMYLSASEDLRVQRAQNSRDTIAANRRYSETTRSFNRRLTRMKQIMSSQMQSLQQQRDDENRMNASKLSRLQSRLNAEIKAHSDEVQQLRAELAAEKRAHSDEVTGLRAEITASKSKEKELARKNLIYNQRLDAAQSENEQHEANVSEMQSRISETVAASKTLQSKLSNRDKENNQLRAQLSQLRSNLSDYQIAYAQLYAAATGGDQNVSIDASMTVNELNSRIVGSRSVSAPSITDEVYTDIDVDSSELTTL